MSILSAPVLVPPNSGDGNSIITVYIGKIPEALSPDILDSLLGLFRPQLLRWRRAEGSERNALMPFGFADFTDAAVADTFRRVFETLELTIDDEKGTKTVKLLVKVGAPAEELITEGTKKTMEETANKMIEEEKRRIAALPPGMEGTKLDEQSVIEKAKTEFLKQREDNLKQKLEEARKVLDKMMAKDMKPEDQRNAEEEEKARLRRAKLEKMDRDEEESARGHNQREKERAADAFVRHEKSYKDRERARMYRIAKSRADINGFPAAKRKRPLSLRERNEEQEKDRLDREAELLEIQQQKEKEKEEQQQKEKEEEEQKQMNNEDNEKMDDKQ